MVLDPEPRTGRGGMRGGGGLGGGGFLARLSTETKHATKTTELWAFLAVLAGILIASAMISGDNGDDDFFRADEAWRYITFLTIGYMISRGLAKAGSREPYWATREDLPGGDREDR